MSFFFKYFVVHLSNQSCYQEQGAKRKRWTTAVAVESLPTTDERGMSVRHPRASVSDADVEKKRKRAGNKGRGEPFCRDPKSKRGGSASASK